MTINEIYNEFYIDHVIYNKDYYKEIEQNNNINLEQILLKIGNKIEYNAKAQIYTEQVRANLYNILSVIRNKTLNIKMKEEVNRLITILNTTNQNNTKGYLYAQFYWHFRCFDKKFLQKITPENVLNYESEINDFCALDFPFLNSLIYDNDDVFIEKYYNMEKGLLNLSYILVKRKEILNNINVKTRIEKYLNHLLLKLKSNEPLSYNPVTYLNTRKCLKNIAGKCLNVVKKYSSNMEAKTNKMIDINDNIKLNINQEEITDLLDHFMINALLFGNNYQKLLKNLDNEWLVGLFDYLEVVIKENTTIYSDNIKIHIYDILNYYCDRINNPEIVNRIKELIDIVNKSENTNSEMFYKIQYRLRYIIYEKEQNVIDFDHIEKMVCQSIENDPIFLEQLLNYSEQEFISYNIYSEVSLSNLNYLIAAYPEILQEKTLLSKIYKLLDINKAIKQSVNIDYGYQKRLKETSKKLKKVVKNLPR